MDNEGGGLQLKGGGGLQLKGGGGLQLKGGGGIEEDSDTANSTVDAPSGLRCTTPLTLHGTLISGLRRASRRCLPGAGEGHSAQLVCS